MSTIPPNTPPPPPPPPQGGPGRNVPPQYDAKAQWRAYREQQKAAEYAQRMAWKVQREALRASTPRASSIVGPILLIGIGVMALLVLMGSIGSYDFWTWYAHWWPLLLIGAGLLLLVEWFIDSRREKPPIRRRAGISGLIVLLVIVGILASGWSMARNHWMTWNMDGHNNGDWPWFFNLPEHTQDQQVLDQQVAANPTVQVDNARGNVQITAGDVLKVTVQAHKVVYTSNDADAQKAFATISPHVTVTGNTVLVKSDDVASGRVDLTITVPKMAQVTVNTRGDVAAAGLGAGVTVNTARGDVQLNSIDGAVMAHLREGRNNFSAHQINGDVTVDGRTNDFTVSDVKGRVTMNGDVFGDAHIENASGPISVHTSITDVQIASLQGDFTMDSGNLSLSQAKGQVHVVTRSKDITLNEVGGDSYVETKNGSISITPTGSYNITAKNNSGNGNVMITLPANISATVDGHTKNGEITADFGLAASGDTNKTISGRIGTGTAKITLETTNGDLQIQKATASTSTNAASSAAPAPSTNAPHMRTHKGQAQAEQPVTQ